MIYFRRLKRMLILLGAYAIPKKVAALIAKYLLHTVGVGYAVEVYDSGEIRLLHRLFNKGDRFIIFDIGGNIGMYSSIVCNDFPCAEVHVFEPSKKHFQVLVDRLNIYTDRCHLNNFGLGSVKEIRTLYKDSEITGSATLIKRKLQEDMNIAEEVEIRDLPGYLYDKEISDIDFIKIDVEGWEYPIVTTLMPLLEKSKVDYIQFEITVNTIENGFNVSDFLDIFGKNNYKVFIVSPSGSLNFISSRDDLAHIYLSTNYLAISENAIPKRGKLCQL